MVFEAGPIDGTRSNNKLSDDWWCSSIPSILRLLAPADSNKSVAGAATFLLANVYVSKVPFEAGYDAEYGRPWQQGFDEKYTYICAISE
jgi:hypothetical protein